MLYALALTNCCRTVTYGPKQRPSGTWVVAATMKRSPPGDFDVVSFGIDGHIVNFEPQLVRELMEADTQPPRAGLALASCTHGDLCSSTTPNITAVCSSAAPCSGFPTTVRYHGSRPGSFRLFLLKLCLSCDCAIFLDWDSIISPTTTYSRTQVSCLVNHTSLLYAFQGYHTGRLLRFDSEIWATCQNHSKDAPGVRSRSVTPHVGPSVSIYSR